MYFKRIDVMCLPIPKLAGRKAVGICLPSPGRLPGQTNKLQGRVCIILCTVCIVMCIVCIVQFGDSIVKCALYSVQRTVCSI